MEYPPFRLVQRLSKSVRKVISNLNKSCQKLNKSSLKVTKKQKWSKKRLKIGYNCFTYHQKPVKRSQNVFENLSEIFQKWCKSAKKVI